MAILNPSVTAPIRISDVVEVTERNGNSWRGICVGTAPHPGMKFRVSRNGGTAVEVEPNQVMGFST